MTQKVVIIDCGYGNIRSVEKAIAHCGAKVSISRTPEDLDGASHLILPGQGTFKACRQGIEKYIPKLSELVHGQNIPFLGICVGMQLLMAVGMENGQHEGLGWIDGVCEPLNTTKPLPHMGWNTISICQHENTPQAASFYGNKSFYFAHSYVTRPQNAQNVLATADYDGSFPAIIADKNIVGIQCHPEKSQAVGLAFIKDFLDAKLACL